MDGGPWRLDGGRWQVDHGGQVDHSQARPQPGHRHGHGVHPQRHRHRREVAGAASISVAGVATTTGSGSSMCGGRRATRRSARRTSTSCNQARAGRGRERGRTAGLGGHPAGDLEAVPEAQARLPGRRELRERQDHVGADEARRRERSQGGVGLVDDDLSGDLVGEVGPAGVLAGQDQRRGDAGERDLLVRQGRGGGVDGCGLRGRHVVRHPLLQPDGQGGPVERMTVLVGAVPDGAEREGRVRRRTE